MTKPQPPLRAPLAEEEVLRRMLNTPPQKHPPSPSAKRKPKVTEAAPPDAAPLRQKRSRLAAEAPKAAANPQAQREP